MFRRQSISADQGHRNGTHFRECKEARLPTYTEQNVSKNGCNLESYLSSPNNVLVYPRICSKDKTSKGISDNIKRRANPKRRKRRKEREDNVITRPESRLNRGMRRFPEQKAEQIASSSYDAVHGGNKRRYSIDVRD